jgi:hypothetical protein
MRCAVVQVVAKREKPDAQYRPEYFDIAVRQRQCASHYTKPERAYTCWHQKSVVPQPLAQRHNAKDDCQAEADFMDCRIDQQAASRGEEHEDDRGRKAVDKAQASNAQTEPVPAPCFPHLRHCMTVLARFAARYNISFGLLSQCARLCRLCWGVRNVQFQIGITKSGPLAASATLYLGSRPDPPVSCILLEAIRKRFQHRSKRYVPTPRRMP